MRTLAIAIFAFLILAVPAFALTPLEAFLNKSFEPDQEARAEKLQAAGDYYLVTADTIETYVVDGATGNAVKEKVRLQEILAQDAKEKSNLAEKAAVALGLDEEMLEAKETNEKKCMQYLGVDMHPCSDRESCIVSCFSVPQCSAGPLYSDGFLEAFMEWNLGRQRFVSLIVSYADSQERILEDATAVNQKLSILYELAALSQNLSRNPIFLSRFDEGCSGGGTVRCYEYCPKIDYSEARIEAGKQSLVSLKAALGSVALQAARAEAILNRSSQNDYYLATRKGLFAEFRNAMEKRIKNITGMSDSLSKKVFDPELQPLLVRLSSGFTGMEEDAAAGLYRKALGRRAALEELAENASARISNDEFQQEKLEAKYETIRKKILNSAWLIGNASAEIYLAELSQIKANATAPMPLQDIASVKEKAEALDDRVDEDIASAATEQGAGKPNEILQGIFPQTSASKAPGEGGASPAQGVPISCPFALALLPLIALVFARR